MRSILFVNPLVLGAVLLAAGPVRALDDWKFEVLHLKGGGTLQGLVIEETPTQIKFWQVKRPPGKPSLRLHHTLNRREVVRIDQLSAKERELLSARIQALSPKVTDEKLLLRKLDLRPAPWGKGQKVQGLKYTSVHFVLLSNARWDIVGRAAIRLEQVYAAYARFLPPRRSLTAAKPTTILLVHSLDEYAAMVKSRVPKVFKAAYYPAYYDQRHNQIVCGSDFQRLGEALEKVRKQHEQWDRQYAKIKRRYPKKIPAVLRAQILRDRAEMKRVTRKNDQVFELASQRLFQILYHEAFHAYLANFVYPGEDVVPRWLNEGLAQLFETAVVEVGELRVGHVDQVRLGKVQALANRGDLVAVADLLKAGPTQFQVVHASDRQLADRYYLTSWALAFYLLVQRQALADPRKLDRYVRALQGGTKPQAAFRQLTGLPLRRFEKEFRDYVRRLKPDGSLAKAARK
jgi:hypothetical protein